jgi:hypothetical protein
MASSLKNTVITGTGSIVTPNQTTSTVGGTAKLRFNTTSSQNTLEFNDGSGWRPVTGYSQGIVGTGGTISYVPGGGIVHSFTSTGASTFTPTFSGNVQVLVVAGGGSSGYDWAGGGGGGGVIFNRSFPVSAGVGIPISVGTGGTGRVPAVAGPSGGNSVFGSITATGGGGGGSWAPNVTAPSQNNGTTAGRNGGSGGGGSNTGDGPTPGPTSRIRVYGGRGTTGQGYPGGAGVRFNADIENTHQGGGGGGAGGPGGGVNDGRQNYRGSFRSDALVGGAGRSTDILGGNVYFGGGGAGGGHLGWGFADGGIGGGGGGSHHHGGPYGGTIKQGHGGGNALTTGQPGQPTARGGHGGANTGGGAGGGQHGADGGTGIVIVKY